MSFFHCLLCFPFLSHILPPFFCLFYLFFPPLQPCVAVLRGTLCCPQPLSAVLRVLLLWRRLFLSSSTTTTTLYYPPLPTSWQVHTLCTTCLPACPSETETLRLSSLSINLSGLSICHYRRVCMWSIRNHTASPFLTCSWDDQCDFEKCLNRLCNNLISIAGDFA